MNDPKLTSSLETRSVLPLFALHSTPRTFHDVEVASNVAAGAGKAPRSLACVVYRAAVA